MPRKLPVARSSVHRSVPIPLPSSASFETAPLSAKSVAAVIVSAYPSRGRRRSEGIPGGSASSVTERGYPSTRGRPPSRLSGR